MTNAVLPEWLNLQAWRPPPSPPEARIRAAIAAETPGGPDLGIMLSDAADAFLEHMAQRAQHLTRRHFGRTVSLYVPLYLSNYCSGGCAYCGFASDRKTPRRRLDPEDVAHELAALKQLGFEEVLLLTGERTPQADFQYLKTCVQLAAAHFHTVAVEAFPMTTDEYRALADAGCTSVTLYQETYDPDLYDNLHRWGPKRDYTNRLDAPERALRAGIRTVGIGALLGLKDPVEEALALYAHALRLQRTYWRSGVTISFPRLRPEAGGFSAPNPVGERMLARLICAMRIVLPDVPLVLSTREGPAFRDGIAGIGISKMSAASRTTVGGYADDDADQTGQFDVSDSRSVEKICSKLREKGLEPVFKNWDAVYR
jgi:2-iminoacetate synthase